MNNDEMDEDEMDIRFFPNTIHKNMGIEYILDKMNLMPTKEMIIIAEDILKNMKSPGEEFKLKMSQNNEKE